jgi:hypothetical protein
MWTQPSSGASPTQRAERAQRLRLWVIVIETSLFLASQVAFLAFDRGSPRPWGTTAWGLTGTALAASFSLGLAAALLTLLSGKGTFFDGTMQALWDDETTRGHRDAATALGYWTVVPTAMALQAYALFKPLSVISELHVLLIVGIGVPLLRFAQLEWRAIRG